MLMWSVGPRKARLFGSEDFPWQLPSPDLEPRRLGVATRGALARLRGKRTVGSPYEPWSKLRFSGLYHRLCGILLKGLPGSVSGVLTRAHVSCYQLAGLSVKGPWGYLGG